MFEFYLPIRLSFPGIKLIKVRKNSRLNHLLVDYGEGVKTCSGGTALWWPWYSYQLLLEVSKLYPFLLHLLELL